ncbi:MAG: membrane protein insertion efficiency factor YidD [Coriobacteriia bacterium]
MSRLSSTVRRPLDVAAIAVIQGYRAIVSPLFPAVCRFTPSCSAYAAGCVERYGVFKGGWLAVRRVARCHPWNPGGWDPVP